MCVTWLRSFLENLPFLLWFPSWMTTFVLPWLPANLPHASWLSFDSIDGVLWPRIFLARARTLASSSGLMPFALGNIWIAKRACFLSGMGKRPDECPALGLIVADFLRLLTLSFFSRRSLSESPSDSPPSVM